jgi:hypothetical protein
VTDAIAPAVLRTGDLADHQSNEGQVARASSPRGLIAGSRADLVGERRSGGRAAATAAPLGPVLGRHQPQRWPVKHLAGLDPDHRRVGKIRAAPTAPAGDMLDGKHNPQRCQSI